MIKIISTTWGHHDSNSYQGSILYRSFVKHNNPDNFINIHFNRGNFHCEEHDYGSRLGQMSEYILYKIHLTKQEVEKIDTEFIEYLGESEIPFCIVFTKADKLSQKQVNESVEVYKNFLLEMWDELPPLFITSAEKHVGREDILKSIDELIQTSPYRIGK